MTQKIASLELKIKEQNELPKITKSDSYNSKPLKSPQSKKLADSKNHDFNSNIEVLSPGPNKDLSEKSDKNKDEFLEPEEILRPLIVHSETEEKAPIKKLLKEQENNKSFTKSMQNVSKEILINIENN